MVSVLQRVCHRRNCTNTRTLEAQGTLKIENRTPLSSISGAAVEIVLERTEGGAWLRRAWPVCTFRIFGAECLFFKAQFALGMLRLPLPRRPIRLQGLVSTVKGEVRLVIKA